MDKQKYGAAQKEFEKVINSGENISASSRANAYYFVGKCAAELFNRDAEYLLLEFINKYPSNPYYQSALYDLGIYFYRQKRYKSAVEWLAKIDHTYLDQTKKDEINFKLGYAYYMTNDYDKAGKAFYAMKDGTTKYATAAQYYYGHISYVNENYETALNSFLKLRDSESFGQIVPFYITQIYYKQRKYDEVLKYASAVHDTTNSKNGLEIGRMIGESYYRNDKYKEALPYMLDYEKNSGAAVRSDYYAIGYSYYRLNDYDNAIPYFQKVVVADDSLGQNGYFHLADCFIHTGNKRSARNAFQSAGKISFDPVIQEESQFNFAKLSYELSFQSVAIEAFRNFIKSYPQSSYVNQANEMLIDIYANTHNYKDAIAELDAIKTKTPGLKIAYQRVAYYRGVELFMDNNNTEAVKMFQLSNTYPVDQRLVAESSYWMGEAYYRMNNYEEAIHYFSDFLVTPGAMRNKKYNNANYNIGYALFKQGNYNEAQFYFGKFLGEKSDPARTNDAMLRLGDCHFMMRNLSTAMDYYNRAIAAKSKASDYALYQKAMISGVQGKMNDKIVSLQKLMDNYPKSVYFDDALYEAGKASLTANNFDKADEYYNKVISNYPNSPFYVKAQLGQALVYYNRNQDEKAMAAYKSIVQKYPNTDESRQALAQIKSISVSQNKVEEYLQYVKTVPNADVTVAAEDSLMYESAELRYTQGNCAGAVEDFDKYLARFPDAIFKLNANYYKSDCLFREKKYALALPGYEYVISQPTGNFTEKSLLNAAVINYTLKQYDKAMVDFESLEKVAKAKENIVASLAGQLRSSYRLNDCDMASEVSKKVIASEYADKDLQNEAHLIAGRCFVKKENWTDAKSELTIVAKRTNSEMTAESKYLLALVEFRTNNYKESQKRILEIQKQNPSYDYWVAKGFILLGDNYLALKDTFQARETYKSIVDNYEKDSTDPDDLKQISGEKLNAITEAIIPKPNITPEDSTEIQPK